MASGHRHRHFRIALQALGLCFSYAVLGQSALAQRLEAVTASAAQSARGSIAAPANNQARLPVNRSQLEFTLLEMMRGNQPVTPKGVGLVAYTLAEFAVAGRLSARQAVEISALAGMYARGSRADRAEDFEDFMYSVGQIADEARMNAHYRASLLRTMQGVR